MLPGLGTWSDRRAERSLGTLSCAVLVLIALMIGYVLVNAWPSFSHNGLAWFGPGGDVDAQLAKIYGSPADPHHWVYTIHAWPLIYATLLTTLVAVVFALTFAVLSGIFIVEFSPPRLRRALEPVVRLLAAVPSVVYGLFGLLVLAPFFNNQLTSQGRRDSVAYVVSLTGQNLSVAIMVLAVMIAPLMIAIVVDALRAVPRGWTEGAAALGVNRWRAMWTISVRAARPAIVAATIIATGRALGEAIMLSMVSGSRAFAPNPLDGLTMLFEPVRPLAATIVDNNEGISVKPFSQTIYALAAVLLVSSAMMSFAGWTVRRKMTRYGVR